MDANISTMTMPKTMPAQNLIRYIGFKPLLSKYVYVYNVTGLVKNTLRRPCWILSWCFISICMLVLLKCLKAQFLSEYKWQQ